MKTYFLTSILFLVFSTTETICQVKNSVKNNQVLLKLYINGFYENTEDDEYNGPFTQVVDYVYKSDNFDFGILSFGAELKKIRFFNHEFEIMPLSIKHNNVTETIYFNDTSATSSLLGGSKNTTVKSHFRYQANHYFLEGKTFNPYFGFSARTFYSYEVNKPYESIYYKQSTSDIGLQLAITPGLNINLGKKFILDLNIPVSFYEIKLITTNTQNPALPVHEQKNSTIIGETMPRFFNFRIGLFYRI